MSARYSTQTYVASRTQYGVGARSACTVMSAEMILMVKNLGRDSISSDVLDAVLENVRFSMSWLSSPRFHTTVLYTQASSKYFAYQGAITRPGEEHAAFEDVYNKIPDYRDNFTSASFEYVGSMQG